jgi:cystathionine beta-lyase/cystathionine gamma-synthase
MGSERHGYRHREVGGQTLHPETLMMGYGYDPVLSEGALKPPIFHTSTFVFENAEAGKSYFELAYGLREPEPGEVPGLIYSRINNPDLQVLEERLCLWDGAESGLVFSSGMSAITTTLLTLPAPRRRRRPQRARVRRHASTCCTRSCRSSACDASASTPARARAWRTPSAPPPRRGPYA